ncbi:MAG: dockerin type I repeat-containing protein [Ruminococcus sp.]|nr:dockerin type I repeat-containing protein [Ruminococcus sp.]
MKKILCITMVLVLFVLSSVSAVVVSADTEDLYTQPEAFLYGDVDLDGVLTVKDATYLQKGLAGLTYITAVQRYMAEPERGDITIKNATAIQKHLAGLEVEAPLGEELVMASRDEFSGTVWEVGDYDGEFISVTPKDGLGYEYTLEDFPEYKFSKIEKVERSSVNLIYYRLYLQDPGKENALESLEALDYRANIDLESVELDYYVLAT